MSDYHINVHETIYSLSDALDLVGVVQVHHGKRVGYMAAECGKAMGLDDRALDNLFQAAILHDCGVSNTAVHQRLTQFDWEKDAHGHCEVGASILRSSPPLSHLSDIVMHHHTHWSQYPSLKVSEETALLANCIFMVDRVDTLSLKAQLQHANILLGIDDIRQKIDAKRGDWFKSEWVDAFLEVSDSEAFWLSLEREHVDGYVGEWIGHDSTKAVGFADLKSIVQIFSYIVDAKSSFTQEHSNGVAQLSSYVGGLFDLPQSHCETLELAGLLHDIGKLRVPDEVLEKPGKLTLPEFKVIQRHSFDTFNILKRIKGFEEIALWAGQHHERVGGGGYPCRAKESQLSIEARILAVADVFQALAQNRPYRKALSPETILSILKKEADEGKLDQSVVDMIRKHLLACWNVALLHDDLSKEFTDVET